MPVRFAAVLILLLPAVLPAQDAEVTRYLREFSLPKTAASGDIICFFCPVRVAGTVNGDIIAIGGDIEIEGTVKGDAVAFGGRVRLLKGSHVEGEASAFGGSIEAAPDAIVRGERDAMPYVHMPGQRRPHPAGALAFLAGNMLLTLLGAAIFRSARSANTALAIRRRPLLILGAGCALLVVWVLVLSLSAPNMWVAALHLIASLLFLAMLWCGYAGLAWMAGELAVGSRRGLAKWGAGGLILTAAMLIPVAGAAVFVLLLPATLGAALVSRMGRDDGPAQTKAQAQSAA